MGNLKIRALSVLFSPHLFTTEIIGFIPDKVLPFGLTLPLKNFFPKDKAGLKSKLGDDKDESKSCKHYNVLHHEAFNHIQFQ